MSVSTRPARRTQRRILGWGVAVAGLLYVVGAPIYVDRIEADLNERVGDALAAAGFEGVSVTFSGQTGSVACDAPLGDPSAAVAIVAGVRGVRTVLDLPDRCRVRTGDEPDPGTSLTVASDDSTTSTTSPPVDFATVWAVLGGNPQFSLLYQLVLDADLVGTFTGEGPITLFAPTDEAFDGVSADAIAQLRSDTDLLVRVLRHHVVESRVTSDELSAGTFVTSNGDRLTVSTNGESTNGESGNGESGSGESGRGESVLIDGATVVEADVMAENGVVHSIDRLLLPVDVDLTAPSVSASVSATFADGEFVLRGVVRSDAERRVIVDAAIAALDPTRVIDELTIDAEVGIDPTTTAALAGLVAALPDSLVTGVVGFDGTMLFVSGTYADTQGRDTMVAAAGAVDADLALSERPEATVDDAELLEAELNEFVRNAPIRFEPSSALLDDTAEPVVAEIARRILEFAGVTVTIEGHTDSDGDERENLILSRQRAAAVRDALIRLGVDAASVVAEGFGSSRPVLVAGVEDKTASRRVEFRVITAS